MKAPRIESALPPDGEIAVLSPHLDDAALSLGGSIAGATRNGREVRIITVFAYDPDHVGPPKAWDAVCGFTSAEEAARVRRAEDARACEILGAKPVWLPFGDVEYDENRDEDEIRAAVTDAVGQARVVLIPGFPLAAPDHAWLTRLLLRRPLPSTRVGFYVEQPYAAWRLIGRGGRAGAEGLSPWRGMTNFLSISLRKNRARQLQQPQFSAELTEQLAQSPQWIVSKVTPALRRAKGQAIHAYRSQVRNFGPLVLRRIALYERAWGGEGIGWITFRDHNGE